MSRLRTQGTFPRGYAYNILILLYITRIILLAQWWKQATDP